MTLQKKIIEVFRAADGKSLVAASVVSRLDSMFGIKAQHRSISRSMATLRNKGKLTKISHGIYELSAKPNAGKVCPPMIHDASKPYARSIINQPVVFTAKPKNEIILTQKNKTFLERFKSLTGAQTVDGAVNKIIDQYKEDLWDEIEGCL